MADKEKPQDDLSIEEILGSIRRIIAEDDEPQTADAATPAETPVQPVLQAINAEIEEMDVPEEEPLELTNKIEEDGTIIHTPIDELSLDDTPAEPIDLSLDDAPEPVVAAAPQEKPENIALVEEPKTMSTDNVIPDNLLSPSASIATAAVMAKLARQAAINETGNSSVTLEAMVKEMIRPMLKEWLDANLPDLVQKMVERELERLTKRL